MAYDVKKKTDERADDRALIINGETYKPKPWTIGLDQEIQAVREPLVDLFEQLNAARLDEAGLNVNGEPKTPAPAKKKLLEARARVIDLNKQIFRIRCQVIATALQASDAGGTLTADVIVEHMELGQVTEYTALLFADGTPSLGEGPTSGSDSD